MPITPAEELISTTPAPSIRTVSADAKVISPVPVLAKAMLPVPEVRTNPVAPVAFPIVIVRAAAPVPMFIA